MAQTGISANRLELMQIADAVAREKSIDRKIVIEAMEDAIQKAAKARYGAENDIRCEIDPSLPPDVKRQACKQQQEDEEARQEQIRAEHDAGQAFAR